jgi:uncharacterized delta-60 repeat protein
LTQDANGRLVAAFGKSSTFWIGRYLTEGTLDLSFGGGDGYVQTPRGFGARANAVAVQRDGKILAAGSTEAGVFVLVRYEADGSRRDPSFGKKRGHTITVAGPNGGGAQDLEIQPSGRILAAGFGIDAHHRWEAMVTAYRPNGRPDRSFGGGDGIAGLKTRGTLPIELVSVEALSSGRIIAVGDLNGQIMVVALRPNGKPDRRFGGGDGLAFTDVDGGRRCVCAYATDMEIDHRGNIVVSANVTQRKREPSALLRYRPNGKLDRSFGKEGVSRAFLGSRLAGKDIAIQRDGRIVQAGTYNVPGTGEARVAVARFLPDGRLDRSFARQGFFTRDFGYESVAYAALTQRDGRIVIGGRANSGPSPFPEDPSIYDTAEVFLIRFLP